MITQERLKELLIYEKPTGVFIWTDKASPKVRHHIAGTITKRGYVNIDVDGKQYKAHRLAWLYVHGYMPKEHIDHINQDKSDNSISNLREASPRQNKYNQGLTTRNTSGFKGVSFHKASGKWRAQINHNNATKYLGLYGTAEEASMAYDKASKEIHGEFAVNAKPSWQGLSTEEIEEMRIKYKVQSTVLAYGILDFARAIEQALKEKNHG